MLLTRVVFFLYASILSMVYNNKGLIKSACVCVVQHAARGAAAGALLYMRCGSDQRNTRAAHKSLAHHQRDKFSQKYIDEDVKFQFSI